MGDDLLKLLDEKFLPWVHKQPEDLIDAYNARVYFFQCNAIIGTEIICRLQINILGELATAKPDLAELIIDFDEHLENITSMAAGENAFDPKQVLSFLNAYHRMLSYCEQTMPGHIKLRDNIIEPEEHSKMWHDLCINYRGILLTELKKPETSPEYYVK
jgi:hypothetical protein